MHALVQSLVALVPPEGSPWPRPSRQRWLTALTAVLDVLYEDDALDSPTPPAPILASPPDAPLRGAQSRPSPFVDGPRPAMVVDIRAEGHPVGAHRAKHVRRET